MTTAPVHAELLRELRGVEPRVLAPLTPTEQTTLLAAIRATRQRQKQALDDAINEGMRLVPALLRGPLRRILFP